MRLTVAKQVNTGNILNINGKGFWLFFSGLCLLLFARDVLQISVPLPIFLAYFAVGYVFMDYDHSLAITAIMPLLNHGVQTNYIVAMAVAMYLYKYGKGLKLNIIHGIVFLLMMLELMHFGKKPFSISEYLRYVVQYTYLALILGESRLKVLLKDPLLVLRTFIYFAVYFMIDVLLVTIRYVDLSRILSGNYRFGVLDEFLYRVATLNDNENMVGMFAMMAIGFLLVCMIKSRKHLIRDSILVAFFVYFGLLTQSKTFLLCLCMEAVLFVLYFMYISQKSAKRMLVVALVVVFLVVISFNVLFKDVAAGVLERFTAKDLGTGRTDLFRRYNQVITQNTSNFLFGIGLQSVRQKTGIWNTPHNGLQEIMVCWGLCGMILMLCLGFNIRRRVKRYSGGKPALCYYFPLLAFFAIIQTMQFVRLSSIFNMLIPLFIAAYVGGIQEAQPPEITPNARN